MGLPLRRCSGQGSHLAKTLEPRVFSRVAPGFSSDDGDYRLPPLLALGSPVFHSSGEGKLGAEPDIDCKNLSYLLNYHLPGGFS